MTELAWREIDLDAVRSNVRQLAAFSAPAALMVVVKADAYSHGAPEVARAALEAGATHLGVAVLEEAFALRREGVEGRLFAWLAAPGAPYGKAIGQDIELAAYSCAQLTEIAEAARTAGRPALVHLKAETGMWRGGAAAEWPQLVGAAREHEREGLLRIVGIWSHLACADVVGDPANDAQLAAFRRAVEIAEESGLRPEFRHLANSAATLTRPDMHFDMVRCGLATYGVNPLVGAPSPVALEPAMTVRARVTHVKEAPPGAGVSYGHAYRTKGETRLALVPVGYADGLPVLAEGGATVGLGGRSAGIAGRVCMDQFVVDVGDLPVVPGDEVTILGPGDTGECTAEEWSAFSGRTRYEMLTAMGGSRLPAVYAGRTIDL